MIKCGSALKWMIHLQMKKLAQEAKYCQTAVYWSSHHQTHRYELQVCSQVVYMCGNFISEEIKIK